MNNAIPRIRVLPLTIVAATLMLTVKVHDLSQGFAAIELGGIAVAAGPEESAGQAASAEPMSGPANEMAARTAEERLEKKLLSGDPTLLTQAEIDILQKLADRRETLEARSQELAMREDLLKAAEARIDRKVEDLQALQKTIEERIKTYDTQQNAKMNSLVKIYENMKPKDAARIFEELDMDTLLSVAERMKERKLAPIMANMNPAKAKEMTVELTRLRVLPPSGSEIEG